MTHSYDSIYELLVKKLGEPNQVFTQPDGGKAQWWEVGEYSFSLIQLRDGTYKVVREKPAVNGHADWLNFESNHKLLKLLEPINPIDEPETEAFDWDKYNGVKRKALLDAIDRFEKLAGSAGSHRHPPHRRNPAFFSEQIRKHDAVPGVLGKSNPSDKAIYFETENFGWILSAVNPETGSRKILLQY